MFDVGLPLSGSHEQFWPPTTRIHWTTCRGRHLDRIAQADELYYLIAG